LRFCRSSNCFLHCQVFKKYST